MSEYTAQLLAVEAKLAKDPENEELLSLKEDLIELIELSGGLEEEEEAQQAKSSSTKATSSNNVNSKNTNSNSKFTSPYSMIDSSSSSHVSKASCSRSDDTIEEKLVVANNNLVDKNSGANNPKRPLSEAELLAKKKEKNRKKKAKLREKMKEQLDIAESEKQSWQSFANKKGLKGVTKKSIFASPCSLMGKVGIGTNGIADAPSAAASTGNALSKRK